MTSQAQAAASGWQAMRNKANWRKCQVAPPPPGVIPAEGGWATWWRTRRCETKPIWPCRASGGHSPPYTKRRAKQSQLAGEQMKAKCHQEEELWKVVPCHPSAKQSQLDEVSGSTPAPGGDPSRGRLGYMLAGPPVRNKANLREEDWSKRHLPASCETKPICRGQTGGVRREGTAWVVLRNKANGGERGRLQCARKGIKRRNALRRHYERDRVCETKPICGGGRWAQPTHPFQGGRRCQSSGLIRIPHGKRQKRVPSRYRSNL